MLAAFPLLVIGPISDRFGIRWTTCGVAIGLVAACFVTSQSIGFYSLLVGFLLLRFLGQGALTLLGSNIVSMWFQMRLGTVNAVISAGGALAFAAVPLLLLESIGSYGWRQTYVGMGVFILVTLVPAVVFLLRDKPEDLGKSQDGFILGSALNTALQFSRKSERDFTLSQAVRHRTFWILAADMALWAMIGTGIVFYALPIFQEYGIAPERSKLLFATFSASMLLAQVIGGVLADRFPMHRLLALGFLLICSGAVVVPLTSSEVHMHLFALLFGAGQGLAITVNSTMWVRYYGRAHLGKIRGMVWSSTVAGSGCGPLILGLFRDHLGSFTPGLWIFAGLLFPLVFLSLWATAPRLPSDMGDPVDMGAPVDWDDSVDSQPRGNFGDGDVSDEDSFLATSLTTSD